MAILTIEHEGTTGAGRLARVFRDHGFRFDVRRLGPHDEPTNLPVDTDDFEGLLLMGGLPNISDNPPWLSRVTQLIRHAHARELPVIGVCFGAQLVAQALGGQVSKMEKPEFGYAPVHINPLGQVETIFAGVPWSAPQFHAHGAEVSQLPEGGVLLASSDACKVQAYRVGIRTYAFQFHFEADRPMREEMMDNGAAAMEALGLTREDIAAQEAEFDARCARAADRLCGNLVTYLFPLSSRLSA